MFARLGLKNSYSRFSNFYSNNGSNIIHSIDGQQQQQQQQISCNDFLVRMLSCFPSENTVDDAIATEASRCSSIGKSILSFARKHPRERCRGMWEGLLPILSLHRLDTQLRCRDPHPVSARGRSRFCCDCKW